jgi:hypothetical protein
MYAFPLNMAISLHYNYNCITHAIRLERRRKMTKRSWTRDRALQIARRRKMTKRSWTGDRALQIAETVLNGEITPTMDRLTPARILEIANAAVKSKGYAAYADFNDDLFLEIMAGRPPHEIGWRLNEPRNVLRANLWTIDGKPAKFFPPQR